MRILLVLTAAATALGVAIAAWAVRPANGDPGAPLRVRVDDGSPPTLVLERGNAELEGLDRAAARVGQGALLERDGTAWVLAATLVVEEGATLRLDDQDLRLVSEPGTFVGLEARGGRISVADSMVTSWDR
ncbi:MAG TPA: hypothetical protein VE669_05475, partial [Actinomycetota bacterium]|nr:hypothetical protein [Actinomycetota bacterium]